MRPTSIRRTRARAWPIIPRSQSASLKKLRRGAARGQIDSLSKDPLSRQRLQRCAVRLSRIWATMRVVVAQPTIPLYTYAEYLGALEASHIRLEFVDGLVYAMAGGTPEHNRIVMRLTLLVGNQLVRPCEAYGPDQKIRAGAATFFPDLSVVCGEPQLADDDRNAFTNPSSVFEVLSPSTAATDQTTKAVDTRR